MELNCALDVDILWTIRKGIGEHFEVEIISHGLRNVNCVDKKLSNAGGVTSVWGDPEDSVDDLWDSIETLSTGL